MKLQLATFLFVMSSTVAAFSQEKQSATTVDPVSGIDKKTTEAIEKAFGAYMEAVKGSEQFPVPPLSTHLVQLRNKFDAIDDRFAQRLAGGMDVSRALDLRSSERRQVYVNFKNDRMREYWAYRILEHTTREQKSKLVNQWDPRKWRKKTIYMKSPSDDMQICLSSPKPEYRIIQRDGTTDHWDAVKVNEDRTVATFRISARDRYASETRSSIKARVYIGSEYRQEYIDKKVNAELAILHDTFE